MGLVDSVPQLPAMTAAPHEMGDGGGKSQDFKLGLQKVTC